MKRPSAAVSTYWNVPSFIRRPMRCILADPPAAADGGSALMDAMRPSPARSTGVAATTTGAVLVAAGGMTTVLGGGGVVTTGAGVTITGAGAGVTGSDVAHAPSTASETSDKGR